MRKYDDFFKPFESTETKQKEYRTILPLDLTSVKDCPYCSCKTDSKIRFFTKMFVGDEQLERILNNQDKEKELTIRMQQRELSEKIEGFIEKKSGDEKAKYPLSKEEETLLQEGTVKNLIQLVSECTNCELLFTENYLEYTSHYYYEGDNEVFGWIKYNVFPNDKIYFSEDINRISNRFKDYFNEAETAYGQGLYKVCGSAYRTALEYLIKDYATNKNPQLQSRIQSEELFSCINNYIGNKAIKDCAHKVRILGNESTHYQEEGKEFTRKDLDLLRDFISLTLYWLEQQLKTDRLIQAFNNRP